MYRSIAKELSTSIGVPMEGFFDGTDVVLATPAPFAAAHGVLVEALILPSEPIPKVEGTHTERVSETTLILAKTPISPEGVIPAAAQTEATSPILPLVVSTSDPFTTLSQAVKDGSSLVVTLSSIPNSATRGPNADLSSEESEDILKDPKDEPVLKKRIYDSNEEESAPFKIEFMSMCFFFFFFSLSPFLFFILYIHMYLCCGLPFICMFVSLFAKTFEGLGVVTDVGVPSIAPPATPIAPVSTALYVPIYVLPTAPIIAGPGEFPFPLSPSSFLPCKSILFRPQLLISCLVLS